MRTLKFVVNELNLTQDPNCDFSNLVPGTEGYLRAEFSFSPEWNGCVKVAGFWSAMGVEYPPQPLTDGCSCMIPAEALKKQIFKIEILGKRNDGITLKTNRVTVTQDGGRE
jgi:hypothetical protein